MESYCVSDVKLLKSGCEKFVEEFEDEAEFNPLVKCVTIASACNRYWRKKHVPRREVALQPVNGWRGCQSNQSQKARHWLTWHARRLGDETRIRHVDNGGEVRLSGMLVYGIRRDDSNRVRIQRVFLPRMSSLFSPSALQGIGEERRSHL